MGSPEYTYDSTGNQVAVSNQFRNISLENGFTDLRTYTYDAHHNRLTEVFDSDNNGNDVLDSRQSVENHYNSNDNLVLTLTATDVRVDGSIDATSQTVVTNGPAGGIVESNNTVDNGADGTVDETAITTFSRTELSDGFSALLVEFFGQ